MKSFLGNFYRQLAIFSGHTDSIDPLQTMESVERNKAQTLILRSTVVGGLENFLIRYRNFVEAIFKINFAVGTNWPIFRFWFLLYRSF